MSRQVLPVLFSLALTACFSPVPEAQCLRDLDCVDAGVCVDNRCTGTAAGGGGGASTGGGTNGGGSGGGVSGGGVGGSSGGGTGGAGGSSGGGTGGAGGGAGGGGSACGCRDGLGNCQTGTSAFACGANGGQCAMCGFGSQCVNGACTMGACGPQSCAGCCTNNFCVVPGQQSRFACGTAGQMCSQCPMGQGCQNGVCSSPACDVISCPNGCCANGQCQSGMSRLACGLAGQMCMRCGTGQNCTSGICLNNTGFDGGFPMMDAGSTVPPGSPCTSSQNCQPPFNAICIQENLGGQSTGYTGGYCSSTCGGTPCPPASLCVTESFFGAAQSTCRASCSQPGQQSSCRTGYVCAPSPVSSVPGFCRPRCDNGGALSACATGQTCNTTTGVCQ